MLSSSIEFFCAIGLLVVLFLALPATIKASKSIELTRKISLQLIASDKVVERANKIILILSELDAKNNHGSDGLVNMRAAVELEAERVSRRLEDYMKGGGREIKAIQPIHNQAMKLSEMVVALDRELDKHIFKGEDNINETR